jgi:hypothetical protein
VLDIHLSAHPPVDKQLKARLFFISLLPDQPKR